MTLKNYPLIKQSSNSENYIFNQKLIYNNSSLISNKNSIIFPQKSNLNFWSFKNNLANKKKGKLLELIFFGLNYNAKRVKYFRKPFVLDLQKSHKISIFETRVSNIKTKIFKRRVLLFSYERQKITELVNLMKKQRPQNSYSGHGLILKTDNYSTKPGKVRQK